MAELPINTKTIKQKQRFFNYVIVSRGQHFYVNKRSEKDIWQNLYEFILIETKEWLSENEITVNEQFLKIFNLRNFKVIFISKKISQKLTHQSITGRFIHVEIEKKLTNKKYVEANLDELKTLPFPRFIASYLADKNVSLNLI